MWGSIVLMSLNRHELSLIDDFALIGEVGSLTAQLTRFFRCFVKIS